MIIWKTNFSNARANALLLLPPPATRCSSSPGTLKVSDWRLLSLHLEKEVINPETTTFIMFRVLCNWEVPIYISNSLLTFHNTIELLVRSNSRKIEATRYSNKIHKKWSFCGIINFLYAKWWFLVCNWWATFYVSTLRVNIFFSLENIFLLVHLEYMTLLGIVHGKWV